MPLTRVLHPACSSSLEAGAIRPSALRRACALPPPHHPSLRPLVQGLVGSYAPGGLRKIGPIPTRKVILALIPLPIVVLKYPIRASRVGASPSESEISSSSTSCKGCRCFFQRKNVQPVGIPQQDSNLMVNFKKNAIFQFPNLSAFVPVTFSARPRPSVRKYNKLGTL